MIELAEVCLAVVDCEHKTAPKSAQGYPLIRTTDIGRGRLSLSDVQRVDPQAYQEWTRRAVPQPGDLILAREAPVGNVALVTPGLEPVLGQRTVLLRPDPDLIDADYLTYRLLAPDIQHWMSGVANGATVPHLNMEDIRALPLPTLPPLAEQRRIGAALSAFDDLVENNWRRIEILEEMARLVYREWFVHFRFPGHEDVDLIDSDLGPIPKDWEVRHLSDVMELVYGKALKGDNRRGGDVAVYGSGGIVGWHDEALVHGPGVIVGRKGNVGAVHWSDGDFYPIDTTYFVKTEVPISFAYQQLQTMEFIDSHAAVPGLSREQAYSLKVAVPGDALLDRFEEVVTPMYELRRNLLSQVTVLKRARELLLPRLITGELDVSGLDLDLELVA